MSGLTIGSAMGRLARGWIRSLRAALSVCVAWTALVLAEPPATANPPQDSPSGGGATPSAIPASRAADHVVVITIHGTIDKYTAVSVVRRIRDAEKAAERAARDGKTVALVFEIDSPGGEVGAVLDICGAIKQSTIKRTIAWIHPDAYSGGAIVALACSEIVANDASALGDALPVQFNPLIGLKSMSDVERQKFLAPLASEVVDSARRFGWDEFLVQAMLTPVELWQVEETTTGRRYCVNETEYRAIFGTDPPRGNPDLVSFGSAASSGAGGASSPPSPADAPTPAAATPPDEPRGRTGFVPAGPQLAAAGDSVELEPGLASRRPTFSPASAGRFTLVRYVSDGRAPATLRGSQLKSYGFSSASVNNDTDLKAYLGAGSLSRLDMSWSEHMAGFLTMFVVRGILIVLFLLTLFIEMTHPGAILPGAIAGVCLFLLVAPPLVVGMASWWAVAAIFAGILLIAVELLLIPGFGLPGVVGLVLLFGGMVGTFMPVGSGGILEDTPEARQSLLTGVATVLLSTVTAVFAMYYTARHFASLPLLSRLVLQDPDPSEMGPTVASPARPGEGMYADAMIMVGDEGLAITPLRPAGRAQFGERIIDVVSAIGFIEQGARVRIASREGFRVTVDPVREEPKEGRTVG